MSETTKNIFIGETDTVLSRVEILPDEHLVIQEISRVTDRGNLRGIFVNMKFFLETGTIPESPQGYSVLSAVVFGLPVFQDFLAEEFAGKISPEDIRDMSTRYLEEYKKVVAS